MIFATKWTNVVMKVILILVIMSEHISYWQVCMTWKDTIQVPVTISSLQHLLHILMKAFVQSDINKVFLYQKIKTIYCYVSNSSNFQHMNDTT
jgi:hypothetical protein